MKIIFLILSASLASAETIDLRKEESIRHFVEAAKVFQHARCMNCHPAGDQPTQGMDMHIHKILVQRGKVWGGMDSANDNFAKR